MSREAQLLVELSFEDYHHLRYYMYHKLLRTVTVWTCRALAASMAARVEKVIQNDGGQVEMNIYT